MAKHTDQRAGDFETENTGGVLAGFLAEEDELDRRSLWRIGSWGFAAVGAIIVALLANQSSMGLRREQIAADELARQAQLIRSAARENQNETKRLVSAVDTLNSDRDRLYSRVTMLEQGLDSVTGAIGRQNTAAASPAPPATSEPVAAAQNPSPAVAPVATAAATSAERPRAATAEPAPATVASIAPGASNAPAATPVMPLMASKSIMAPPDPAAGKLIEPEMPPSVVMAAPIPEVVAAASSADNAEADAPHAPKLQRTEFGVDVGGANSVGGLRALWRGLLKSRVNAPLTALRPIIVVKEGNNGLGMQLRLVAGPLGDAAAAARICATLIENDRSCETTVFDGQRLAMKAEDPPASVKPAPPRRRVVQKRAAVQEEPPPKKPETSTISSLFGRKNSSQ